MISPIFSEFYHKIHKNALINCWYEHFYLTPDPLPTVGPPILHIFRLLGPPIPLPPGPLPDFRRTPGGWGGGYPPAPTYVDDTPLRLQGVDAPPPPLGGPRKLETYLAQNKRKIRFP